MEDEFGVAYQQTADEKDLEYAFFGIFDGHGGREAALFAKVSRFHGFRAGRDLCGNFKYEAVYCKGSNKVIFKVGK